MPEKNKAEALHCAVSNKELSLDEGVFLTVSPEGLLIVDLRKELPSAHIFLECRREVIDVALAAGILQKTFGENLKIPDCFVDKVLETLQKQVVNMLCMARKSGLLVFGFEKVSEAIEKGVVDFILRASDSKSAAQNQSGLNAGFLRICGVFKSIELGGVVGRGRVVHMAVLKGNIKLSKKLIAIITKIENF